VERGGGGLRPSTPGRTSPSAGSSPRTA
jgi:hypothetical protein